MTSYTYYIYHDENQCTNYDLIRPELTDDQLNIEYESIDTELHLYALLNNFELLCNTQQDEKGGVVVCFRNFKSGEEADLFARQFPEWLKTRINTRFCPVIQRETNWLDARKKPCRVL
jgi:hypothetical protein